jgi:hypothetical protein
VLTIPLSLAHNEEKEELRMTAAILLNELASLLGEALCHQFVTPEVRDRKRERERERERQKERERERGRQTVLVGHTGH